MSALRAAYSTAPAAPSDWPKRFSEAFAKWRGVDRGQAAARAIRKLALGNAALGVVPEGTHVVSAPERLEALAKYKPTAP